jgi:UDP-3-O-[3-hydroxymyristoyl] glucosamine N-acyltransferase
MPFTAAEIAKAIGGEVVGNPDLVLTGFAPADRAHPGDLTFAENENYFVRAEQSAASASLWMLFCLLKRHLLKVPNARVAFAKALPLFFPEACFRRRHPSQRCHRCDSRNRSNRSCRPSLRDWR